MSTHGIKAPKNYVWMCGACGRWAVFRSLERCGSMSWTG